MDRVSSCFQFALKLYWQARVMKLFDSIQLSSSLRTKQLTLIIKMVLLCSWMSSFCFGSALTALTSGREDSLELTLLHARF